jgi:hypothetical protein
MPLARRAFQRLPRPRSTPSFHLRQLLYARDVPANSDLNVANDTRSEDAPSAVKNSRKLTFGFTRTILSLSSPPRLLQMQHAAITMFVRPRESYAALSRVIVGETSETRFLLRFIPRIPDSDHQRATMRGNQSPSFFRETPESDRPGTRGSECLVPVSPPRMNSATA